MSNFYAGGCTQQQLMEVLNRLAPQCPICLGKRLYFCIQSECQGSPLFCLLCESSHHLLHRKNELRMLFIDRALVGLMTRQTHEKAQKLTTLIERQKERSQQLVQKQTKLIQLYSRLLQALGEMKDQIAVGDQLHNMYQVVQDAVLGKVTDFREKRNFFEEAFLKASFQNKLFELAKLTALSELTSYLNHYTDNPTNTIEYPTRTISQAIKTVLNEKSQFPTIETLVKQTNIEKYISEQDAPIYWLTADNAHRSRRCKLADQLKCKGNRLIIEPDSFSSDIQVKNTLKELTIVSEMVTVVRFPENLQKLVITSLPFNISVMTQKLPPSLRVLKILVVNSYFSGRTSYILKHLTSLRYLVIKDSSIKPSEIKQIIQLGIQNGIRALLFLKDDTPTKQPSNIIRLTSSRQIRPETVYPHSFNKLERHYLIYKRKLLQIQRIHRTKLQNNTIVAEAVLDFAKSIDEAKLDKDDEKADRKEGRRE